MRNNTPYPWQQTLWSGLVERLKAGRLPHALLLSGPRGMGKRHFADSFAHALLCEAPQDKQIACGRCRSCLLMAAGSHPDYLRVEPEEEGKGIGIDAVREAAKFQALKSQYGRPRVIQLQPADRLNTNAANALLKTLEEPAGDTVLLLSTDRPMALLPTIRSRCQQLIFRPVSETSPPVLAWLTQQLPPDSPEAGLLLQMAGGAPLDAVALVVEEELALRQTLLSELSALEHGTSSALRLAEQWVEQGPQRVLSWLYYTLADMVQLKMVPSASRLANPMQRRDLQALAERVDLYFLQALLSRVQERIGLLHGQANPLVIMEEILLAWKQRRV